ncbi:MAG: hypothetical protein AAF526_00830, partial [Pseudomonadota bacterium]
LAIVSTTSIPSSAPDNLGSTMDPNAKGVPIGRRSPLRRGPYSTPIHRIAASRAAHTGDYDPMARCIAHAMSDAPHDRGDDRAQRARARYEAFKKRRRRPTQGRAPDQEQEPEQ